MAKHRGGAARGHAWWLPLAVAGTAVALWRATPPDARRLRDRTAERDGTGDDGQASPTGGEAGHDDPHGQNAATPTAIPPRGWFDIAKRLVSEISDDRVLAVAAGVTFYALLALFPAVAAFVSVYGLFADAGTIGKQLDSLHGVLPDGGLAIVSEQVRAITSKPSGSLGLASVVGLLVSLWSANAGMKAVFDALNVVYKEKEKRSFIRLNAVSLAFTLGALVVLILAMVAVVVVPVVFNFLGLGGVAATALALARWPVLLALVGVGLAVLYRYGPSRREAQWRWLTPGSALAAVGWLVASLGFSFYVAKFGSYNATYGSLGAAIGFMTWIWISTIVVLIGAELNSEAEHQTRRDTTQGGGKPMGARGARMADEVAQV